MPERKNWPQREEREERLQCITAAVSYSHCTVISNEKDQGVTSVCNARAWGLDFILKEKKIMLWQQKWRFPCFGEQRRQGSSGLKPSQIHYPKQLTTPMPGPHLCSHQTWHGGNILTGCLCQGTLLIPHQQEFRSGAQQVFGSNTRIPNKKWPLPGEVSGRSSLILSPGFLMWVG